MQLRHIRPRSVDWYDAVDDDARGFERLSPEETSKLRWLGEEEVELKVALQHGGTLEHPARNFL
jgi:hypothetical protein